MKVSDHISNIISKYSSVVFGGQGGSVVHLVDSISKNKKLKFIPGQSEQASSLAADAYYRTSGKIGVTLATSGPGILNFLQGMACSYFDSIPSLYIAGSPVRSSLRKNKDIRQIGFQEMEVQDLVKPITKYCTIILNPKNINYEFEKAINIAFSGRMGPVLIEIPDDISRIDLPRNQKKFFKKKEIKKNNNKYPKIKNLLENSKRPIFVIGMGVKLSKGFDLVRNFIKKNKIPYSCSWSAADGFNSKDKYNAGLFGTCGTRPGNFTIQNADLIIFLGVRLGPQLVGSDPKKFSPGSKKVLVEIDSNEFTSQKLPDIDIKVRADVNTFLNSFAKNKFNLKCNDIKKWVNKINILKSSYPILNQRNKNNEKFVDPYFFFSKVSNYFKKNSVVIPDASANLIWAFQAMNITKDLNVFSAFNHSPMGYSIAASVGAYFGDKNKEIYAFIGDGSVPMQVQELETVANYKINSKIFVINNLGYGLVKQTQDVWLKSFYAGVDKKSGLSLPDNIKVARSYGLKTLTIKNNKDVVKKLKQLKKIKGPVLIDVKIDPSSRVKPKIEWGKPLNDMSPRLTSAKLSSIEDFLKR